MTSRNKRGLGRARPRPVALGTQKAEAAAMHYTHFSVVRVGRDPLLSFDGKSHTSNMILKVTRDPKLTKRAKVSQLISFLAEIAGHGQDSWDGGAGEELSTYLRGFEDRFLGEVKQRIRDGMVLWSDLAFLFKPGTEIYVPSMDQGGMVKEVGVRYSFFGGPYLNIELDVIGIKSGTPREDMAETAVFKYDLVKPLSELPVKLMTDEIRNRLTARGEKFRRYTERASYCRYVGSMVRKKWWHREEYRADGRVMVDCQTMRKMDPDYFDSRDGEREGPSGMDRIPDSKLWMCEPKVMAFSFAIKKWGEIEVAGLDDIVFRDRAIDQLVMPDNKKRMILALVKNSAGSFADIVDGKGGGCIFLLHGPPGLGKTLTAEAVAESLKRPLYSVSIGELGTDVQSLEKSLRQILDVTTLWDAVLLLDEADIFLEARDERDIVRNAMVGVFLRLLEYHQGVLFLTTNRVKNFDQAFHSRISVALKYPDMSAVTRLQIWKNLLEASGLGHIRPNKLAHYEINGRQIKNTIRLAITLAKSESREVTAEDIVGCIRLAEEFASDIAGIAAGSRMADAAD
jgi:hypothetical protein